MASYTPVHRLPGIVALRAFTALAAVGLLGGCAAAAVTTGAVAVAGVGVKTAATVAEAGVRAVMPDRSDYSDKWRLECSGNAESDGEVVFHITPEGGERLRDGLKTQLDKRRFTVEVDDGEDVLVKRKGRTPEFALAVAENTVKGLRLNPDKE
jgi:hypothetical protein